MASSNLDLVLSETELSEPERIVSCVNSWMQLDINRRQERAANWSEAVHFLAGNQWIMYNQREHHWEGIPVTDSNRVLDRPVTNHLLRWIITSLSSFTNKPNTIVDPNSDEPADKMDARVSTCVLDYLWEAHEKDELYYEAALWAIVTGTVFRKSMKVLDDYLEVGGKRVPKKCLKPQVISPFLLMFDGLPSRWVDVNCVMQASPEKVEDVKKEYGQDAPGYLTENLEDLKEDENLSLDNMALQLSEGLKGIVDGGSFNSMGSMRGPQNLLKGCLIKKEIYVRPTQKHPKGIMLVVAGDKLVYHSAKDKDLGSPYYYLDGRYWHPYTSYVYNKLPGSIYGIGLAQQLIKVQRRINSIDALISYNRKTMAAPVVFAPETCGIPQGTFIGMPGQVVNYTESPLGGKPYREPGIGLPPSVMEERAALLEDGDRLSLGGDIRSGNNPRGATTLGQLQILTEQSEQSRSKQIEGWEKFIQRSEQLDLLVFKDTYQVPDEKVYSRIQKLSKDISDFDWKTFTGAELQDNLDIRIEKGSTVSRSRLMRQETIKQLLPTPLLQPLLMDPYSQRSLMEEFGLSSLTSDANQDMKYAEFCIEQILSGQYPPTLEGIHNPDVQLPVIMRYMKAPKYLELDETTKLLLDKKRRELVGLLAKVQPIPDTAPPGAEQTQTMQGAA